VQCQKRNGIKKSSKMIGKKLKAKIKKRERNKLKHFKKKTKKS